MKSEIFLVLFDLDGTLFDTQELHAQVECDLMKGRGKEVDPGWLSLNYAGRPTEEVFSEVIGCDVDEARKLCKEKWNFLVPKLDEALPLADLSHLFTELKRRSVRFGIGSSSPKVWVRGLIEKHNLSRFFEPRMILCGDEVQRGKPDPEIWLTLLKSSAGTGILPCNCLVVEDGLAGIQGANSAGMQSALLLPKTAPGSFSIKNVSEVLSLI